MPRSGRIEFDGQPLTAGTLAAYRMHVGYVPQDDLLHVDLTVRENLTFALWLRMARDLKRLECGRVVNHLLARLGLTEAADLPVAQLSGGQRNVGLELVGHPRLLLLDEPTAGLDPATELRLVRYLQRLAVAGTTIICATHVLDNLQLFDRVIVLSERRIDYNGPPGELLAHYGLEKVRLLGPL
jgi:ABC-type multidrug transport system ATPase subunit